MKIEGISAFKYVCTSSKIEPIRSVTVCIYAADRKEADRIFYTDSHRFFDQDLTVVVKEIGKGYRQSDK